MKQKINIAITILIVLLAYFVLIITSTNIDMLSAIFGAIILSVIVYEIKTR